MGDDFGPWILHFDETGVLLESPFRVPADLVGSTSATGFLESPSSPFISSSDQATVAGSRGFKSMATTPDGMHLYGLLEGATVQDSNKDRARSGMLNSNRYCFKARSSGRRCRTPPRGKRCAMTMLERRRAATDARPGPAEATVYSWCAGHKHVCLISQQRDFAASLVVALRRSCAGG